MSFDPYDQNSWFFGSITRYQANDILKRETGKGTFLIRNSTSFTATLVLSVREEHKISHYIIDEIYIDGEPRFKIGEHTFRDVPRLLRYFKNHYLYTTPLVRAAVKEVQYVRGKFEFLGVAKKDLPFQKNEILAVISKDEDHWWRARNANGVVGSIPVPYVELVSVYKKTAVSSFVTKLPPRAPMVVVQQSGPTTIVNHYS